MRYIKGVGPKRGEILERLGVKTVEDLLYYLPARYEDRSKLIPIRNIKLGDSQLVTGEITSLSARRAKSGLPIFQADIKDETAHLHVVWFNQPYLKDYLAKGKRVLLYGRVELRDTVQMLQPEYEILKEEGRSSLNLGRIVPVYPLTEDLTQKYLRGIICCACDEYTKHLKEKLPTYLLAREKLVDVKFALQNIHFPVSFENLERAYRRIVFEEFFTLQLALAMKRRGAHDMKIGLNHKLEGELADALMSSLPFELTAGQNKAMADIGHDMSSGRPMNRLLEGDVGSGKTIVAAYALLLTVQNGFQGVMMAPTEVLARQHFIALSELMMPLGVNVALLVGGMDEPSRKAAYANIKNGEADIIVGTHAVIQEGVEFNQLGLAVIDEQHKFGVNQRAFLKDKGEVPHILVMTATPIPRTLALTIYGDLDISVIRELPKGRKPIVTYWVPEAKRERVYNFVREELAKGRQAYVVCPLIEAPKKNMNNETPWPASRASQGRRSLWSKVQSAAELFEKLKTEEFKDFKVGLLHGRMGSKEKDKVMKDFKKRAIDVLVSTVVIEVGIDVSNATVMLVENAERFGLSQLHQLRGRVGRGEHESYCILISDASTEESAERLGALENTTDGFEIAETDLKLRGPGEFFGTRQHGLPEIRFGNILKDFDIMEAARKSAFEMVARDPGLKEEHHRPLKDVLKERFRGNINLAQVG